VVTHLGLGSKNHLYVQRFLQLTDPLPRMREAVEVPGRAVPRWRRRRRRPSRPGSLEMDALPPSTPTSPSTPRSAGGAEEDLRCGGTEPAEEDLRGGRAVELSRRREGFPHRAIRFFH
jgi:hypothetical protein